MLDTKVIRFQVELTWFFISQQDPHPQAAFSQSSPFRLQSPLHPPTDKMIPPRYAKTASLTNTTSHTVVVTALFGSDEQAAEGQHKYTETLTLAPGQTAQLPEHDYDMGGWTAVAALDSLQVAPEDASVNGAPTLSHFQPAVDSIVGVLHVDITGASSSYHFAVTKQD